MPKSKIPTFEESFDELEQAVQKLEAGDLPLEDSIALFERGMALAGQLEQQLGQAELRVRKLQPNVSELDEADASDGDLDDADA